VPTTVTDPFETFFRTHHSALVAFARSRVGSDHAEDIAAEVWRRASSHVVAGRELTRSWLFAVARNLIVDTWRSEQRLSRHLRLLRPPEHATAADSTETEDLVSTALDTLTSLQRTVLVLYYVDGLTVPAIAPLVSRSPDAVESLVRRARSRFAAACGVTN
jgi:RNA polymerase sigma-70 factor (ECF subfamily)